MATMDTVPPARDLPLCLPHVNTTDTMNTVPPARNLPFCLPRVVMDTGVVVESDNPKMFSSLSVSIPPRPVCKPRCCRTYAWMLVNYVYENSLFGSTVPIKQLIEVMQYNKKSKRRWYDLAAVLKVLYWGSGSPNSFTFFSKFYIYIDAFKKVEPFSDAPFTVAYTTHLLMHKFCHDGVVIIPKNTGSQKMFYRRQYDVLLILCGFGIIKKISTNKYKALWFEEHCV